MSRTVGFRVPHAVVLNAPGMEHRVTLHINADKESVACHANDKVRHYSPEAHCRINPDRKSCTFSSIWNPGRHPSNARSIRGRPSGGEPASVDPQHDTIDDSQGTAAQTSSGAPTRSARFRAIWLMNSSVARVRMGPGTTALTLTRHASYSQAAEVVASNAVLARSVICACGRDGESPDRRGIDGCAALLH